MIFVSAVLDFIARYIYLGTPFRGEMWSKEPFFWHILTHFAVTVPIRKEIFRGKQKIPDIEIMTIEELRMLLELLWSVAKLSNAIWQILLKELFKVSYFTSENLIFRSMKTGFKLGAGLLKTCPSEADNCCMFLSFFKMLQRKSKFSWLNQG